MRRQGVTYQELEEANHSDNTEGVGDERHDRTELRVLRVEERSEEQREHELNEQDGGVPHDGSERHDGDADERRRRLTTVAVGEGLDEHVADDEEHSHHDGEDDFGEDDGAPASARNVAGQLLGGVTEALLLVSSNHRA